MSILGVFIAGGMLGFLFGYATAILMSVAKEQQEVDDNVDKT